MLPKTVHQPMLPKITLSNKKEMTSDRYNTFRTPINTKAFLYNVSLSAHKHTYEITNNYHILMQY